LANVSVFRCNFRILASIPACAIALRLAGEGEIVGSVVGRDFSHCRDQRDKGKLVFLGFVVD